MNPAIFLDLVIRPTLEWMGQKYATQQAEILLLAIMLQESGLKARRQSGNGPARGFPQFELSGLRGVFSHRATRSLAVDLCQQMLVVPDAYAAYEAIEHNDILACALARLLLYSDPKPLPAEGDVEAAWHYYLGLWRPGKKRPLDWPGNYQTAHRAVATGD